MPNGTTAPGNTKPGGAVPIIGSTSSTGRAPPPAATASALSSGEEREATRITTTPTTRGDDHGVSNGRPPALDNRRPRVSLPPQRAPAPPSAAGRAGAPWHRAGGHHHQSGARCRRVRRPAGGRCPRGDVRGRRELRPRAVHRDDRVGRRNAERRDRRVHVAVRAQHAGAARVRGARHAHVAERRHVPDPDDRRRAPAAAGAGADDELRAGRGAGAASPAAAAASRRHACGRRPAHRHRPADHRGRGPSGHTSRSPGPSRRAARSGWSSTGGRRQVPRHGRPRRDDLRDPHVPAGRPAPGRHDDHRAGRDVARQLHREGREPERRAGRLRGEGRRRPAACRGAMHPAGVGSAGNFEIRDARVRINGGCRWTPCAPSSRPSRRARAGRTTSTSSATRRRSGTRIAKPPGEACCPVLRRARHRYRAAPSGPAGPVHRTKRPTCSQFKPRVVSFHFGLPSADLVRARARWERVLSSATTVDEARWLEARGVDAIIAQGLEAGGHRGIFLSDDLTTQIGTLALVPQIVKAVSVPVIAAGGIADSAASPRRWRSVLPACRSAPPTCAARKRRPAPCIARAPKRRRASHRAHQRLHRPTCSRHRQPHRPGDRPDEQRRAAVPSGAAAILPLRAAAEAKGSGDFSPLWSGQNASGCGRSRPPI